MRHPHVLAIAALLGAGALAAGCGSSSSSNTTSSASNAAAQTPSTASSPASTPAAAGTAVGTTHTKLGTVLTAGSKHLTVYLFEADHGTSSACSGACAQAWPPVTTTGAATVAGAAQQSKLGTTTRADGTKQLTYNGHPLYYYVSDQSAGETTGEGVKSFGAAWYVLNPQGKKIDNS